MFFDDRLATVLRQSAQSDSMRRTQFRQLLDLLGAQSSGVRQSARDPSLVAAAWMRMSKLAETIPTKDRERLISEPGWRLRNPELVAHLADFEPGVASAALTRAQLSSDDWNALIPRLPVRARGFMRLRRDLPQEVETTLEQLGVFDRGLPTPQTIASSEHEKALGDDPLELQENDELPGANIPPEDLPSEPLVSGFPAENTEERDGQEMLKPAPARPIFFPKESPKQSEESTKDQDYAPEPFTIEELREIAEEPLGISEGEPADAGDAGPLNEERPKEEPLEANDTLASEDEPAFLSDETHANHSGQTGEQSEISALVERISNFQRARQEGPSRRGASLDHLEGELAQGDKLMPRLPLGEEDSDKVHLVRGFAFAADAAGRIEWAEAEVAPMVVGTRLVAPARFRSDDIQSHELARAFNQRQPMKSAPFALSGAPAISGDWVVDAQPRFSQIGGFAGYVGRMRRPLEAAPASPNPTTAEADRIRQLLHELRTPVTAVQGYSEVIQQQLFGSAPHEYRALAASIASDAARILSGFEELDRLARLETGVLQIDEGQTDIAELAERFVRQLSQVLDARMTGIVLEIGSEKPLLAALDQDTAESLLWRLLASISGACSAGETLDMTLKLEDGAIHLACDLPMQLLAEDDLFAADARPSSTAINPGIFGAGFALRLARAEARAAGGNLTRDEQCITLILPSAVVKQSDQGSDLAAN